MPPRSSVRWFPPNFSNIGKYFPRGWFRHNPLIIWTALGMSKKHSKNEKINDSMPYGFPQFGIIFLYATGNERGCEKQYPSLLWG